MAMDLWDRAHEYNLTTISDELSGRNYAWLDGYAAAASSTAAAVARDPYGDAVAALGPDEPLAVGEKIAAAIESLFKPPSFPPPRPLVLRDDLASRGGRYPQ